MEQRIDSFLRDRESWTPPGANISRSSTSSREYRNAYQLSALDSSPPSSPSSTATRSSGYAESDIHSRVDSVSSASSAPVLTGIPPWYTRRPNDGFPEVQYRYTLPCGIPDCHIWFFPDQYGLWVQHTLSHFGNAGPPSKALCLFCDGPQGTFESQRDPIASWRERLMHIGQHYQEFDYRHEIPKPRPDYHLTQHLAVHGLINTPDLKDAMDRTERPTCPDLNLVSSDVKTKEVIRREELDAREIHDSRKEGRAWRESKAKDKGRQASYRPRRSKEIPIIPKSER